MNVELQPHVLLPEPRLLFHPDRPGDRHVHPLKGLSAYGPFSRSTIPSPIRIATLSPFGESESLFAFLRELNGPAKSRERRDYLIDWHGFNNVFQTKLAPAHSSCRVELDAGTDEEVRKGSTPQLALAERICRAMLRLEANRSEFDVLFIYLPERWSLAFTGPEDFDLHHELKAFAAARQLPFQIVREGSALKYRCRASVMWRIGLALYAKAGGTPWKLADADSDIAYIGISYAMRQTKDDKPRFVTCCSQVFDSDGSGVEFVAYDASEVSVHRENPFLSQTEMFRVITRSLDLYRRRHAGKSPRRVMVHKSTEFQRAELAGCYEALKHCEAVDLLQIVDDVGWSATQWNRDRRTGSAHADKYPVRRGTLLGLTEREALLWVHGAVDASGGRPYFQGGKSTPRPIRVVRHAGHGTWDDTAQAILALSKMNWNNDALYDNLPVTMSYAKTLAQILKRMPFMAKSTYQFRFFM